MSVSITTPVGTAKVAGGAICAEGEVTSGAIEVRAKVYQGAQSPPQTPPDGAIIGTVSTDTFYFDSISGAAHSSTTPYPTNTLAVWAKYPGMPPTWSSASVQFGGKTDTKTDCME